MNLFHDPSSLSDTYILQLFNLQRENVQNISIARKPDGVYAYITLSTSIHTCPVCGDSTTTIKDYTTKKIIHSLVTNTPCFIMYKARRYICNTCGKSFLEHNPFVHKNMKISSMTVCNVLDDLKNANETFISVSKRYRISPTTVAHIFDTHVIVPRKKLPTYLAVDEVYAFKDNRSNYVCVFVDALTKETIDLLPSRKQDDLIKYFRLIPLEERKQVKVVSMDLWATYRSVTKVMFPNACCSADKFHIFQDLHRRIDSIRVRTMKKVRPSSSKKKPEMTVQERYEYDCLDRQYYLLKKFHWLLYINPNKLKEEDESGKQVNKLDPNYPKKYNHKFKRYLNLYDIETMLHECDRDIKRSCELRDHLRDFYNNCNYENAKKKLESLITAFSDSGIKEMVEFSNLMRNWKNEIINSFIIIDDKTNRKISNGISEARNKTIKQLKFNANGFKNWERFRSRVMYVTNPDTTYRINPIRENQRV